MPERPIAVAVLKDHCRVSCRGARMTRNRVRNLPEAGAGISKGLELAQTKREERGIRRVDLAYVQLASSEIARDINRDVVLELIRARQPISRADLARLSGL